jgi:hypothetical protein
MNSFGHDILLVSGNRYPSPCCVNCGQLYSHIAVFNVFSSGGSRWSIDHWSSGGGSGRSQSFLSFGVPPAFGVMFSIFTFDEVGSQFPVISNPIDIFSLVLFSGFGGTFLGSPCSFFFLSGWSIRHFFRNCHLNSSIPSPSESDMNSLLGIMIGSMSFGRTLVLRFLLSSLSSTVAARASSLVRLVPMVVAAVFTTSEPISASHSFFFSVTLCRRVTRSSLLSGTAIAGILFPHITTSSLSKSRMTLFLIMNGVPMIISYLSKLAIST